VNGALAANLADVAETLRCSTVKVREGRHGIGSGVIWDSNGLIVTNSHVVQNRTVSVETSDGRQFPATVQARNPQRDLAALEVKASDLPQTTKGHSERLRVGELVFALGNPMGLTGAVATGVIHALGPVEGLEYQSWIQADVRLAPGNSGGPLADARGRVIGVNSMIARGLGLAVPVDSIERFLRGEKEQPELGVTIEPVAVPASGRNILGLLVAEVVPGSAAQRAGLRRGDVLVSSGRRFFEQPFDLLTAIRNSPPPGRLELELLRAGKQQSVEVTLES
jgi:serine protease Do